MDKNQKKIKSLLKFYKKSKTPIVVTLISNKNVLIQGSITNLNTIFGEPSVVIGKTMVFLGDISLPSIFPVETYLKDSNKTEQNDQSMGDEKTHLTPISTGE